MMDRSTDKNTEKRKENKKTYRGRLVAAFEYVSRVPDSQFFFYQNGRRIIRDARIAISSTAKDINARF